MKKTAIVTGVRGQDGSYLSELLLEKDYDVIGVYRHSATASDDNISGIVTNPNFHLLSCDITDASSVFRLINEYKPTEFYNLAAQSYVKASFDNPVLTFQANAIGVLNILEGIRQCSPETRMYQASTSEMFGDNYNFETTLMDVCGPNTMAFYGQIQNENTGFSPRSPYGVAKIAAHNSCKMYRDAYKLHVSCGILFNHESPRRGKNFVTRKVTDYVARLSLGLTDAKLELGNLDARRDWGHAKDYVEAMYLMLQQPVGDDYVIATGKSHFIYDLCQVAFNRIEIDNWKGYVVSDTADNMRPTDVHYLKGDSSKARKALGWEPKYTFTSLIEEMVESDIRRYRNDEIH